MRIHNFFTENFDSVSPYGGKRISEQKVIENHAKYASPRGIRRIVISLIKRDFKFWAQCD